MAGFDFLFEGFTLLLGLAMAEVLGGYAAMLKLHARRRVAHAAVAPPSSPQLDNPRLDNPHLDNPQRIGWLLPLLMLVVLGLLSTFWLDIYQAQNQIPFNLASVLATLLFIGGYYVIAGLLWPEQPEDWADLDDYYFAHRKFVVLGLLGMGLMQEIALTFAGVEWPEPVPPPELAMLATIVDASGLVSFFAFLALAFVRGRWLNGALLLVMLATLGLDALGSAQGVGLYVPVAPPMAAD